MPPLVVTVQKVLDSLTAAMEGHGLAPGEIILDGQIHRCGTADKPHSLNAWYVAHGDEPVSAAYGDWRTGESWAFCAKGDRELTPEERDRLKARKEADKKRRQEEEAKRHAEARAEAKRILTATMPAPADHAYLVRKRVSPVGDLRIAGDGRLVLPVLDAKGAVQSLQFIAQDGNKLFLLGGKLKGGYYLIPAANGEKTARCTCARATRPGRRSTPRPMPPCWWRSLPATCWPWRKWPGRNTRTARSSSAPTTTPRPRTTRA